MNMNRPLQSQRLNDRRKRFAFVSIALCAILGGTVVMQNDSLQHSAFLTGYVLLGSILFLAAFNLRKLFPFLPVLGRASTWMQLHIYVGLSTFVTFGFHISWQLPNGWFEGFLAGLYLFVACSGVYGLYITRRLPQRLAAIDEEIIFERIPQFRRRLAAEVRELAMGGPESNDVIPRYYVNRLLPFFEKPRGLAYLIFPNSSRCRRLIAELKDLDRYLTVDQRGVSSLLIAFVKKKDDLDYHYGIQGRLKLWLIVHVGMTYSLLAVSLLHAVMAHAFGGGLR
jgi:hypothetical protein